MFLDKKEQYYVSIAQHKISQIPNAQDNDFTIMATRGEITELRHLFTEMDAADKRSHIRSAIPLQPYHDDQANQDYDESITSAYQMMYDLGDEEARDFIEQSRILSDRPIQMKNKLE